MGWAIKGLLIVLALFMIYLLLLSVPMIVNPELQMVWTTFVLIVGANVLFALFALFSFNRN